MYQYKGKEYKTKKAVMHAAGVDYTNCRCWITHNKLLHLPIEEAIEMYRNRPATKMDQRMFLKFPELIYKNRTYRNKKELCASLGISRKSLNLGLYYGLPLEDAIQKSLNYKEHRSAAATDHKGIEFESVTEMCKAYEINRDLYKNRLKLGWTKEKALTTPAGPSGRSVLTGKPIFFDHLGNQYSSMAEMSRAYGITPETYRRRRHILQMSVKDALTTPVRQYEYK